jgi:hypothetical protein
MVSATTVSGAAADWVVEGGGVGVVAVGVDFVVVFGAEAEGDGGVADDGPDPELGGVGGLAAACTVAVPEPLIQLGFPGQAPW